MKNKLLTPNYLNIIVHPLISAKTMNLVQLDFHHLSTPGLIKITAKKFKNNECLT